MESLKADHILDCYGLVCPMPVRRTAQIIQTLSRGQVLQIIATDDWFGPDLEAWLKFQPHELVSLDQSGRETHAYIRKK